jgi:hypothetical protein
MRFILTLPSIRSATLLVALCVSLGMYAEEGVHTDQHEVSVVLTRSDNLNAESIHSATDPYFEGYIQALVDLHYYEYRVVVLVKNHKVWLANLPKNKLLANSIVSFVKDIPEVQEVIVLDGVPPEDIELREKYVRRPQISGIWFPQMTELFQPLIADPRQVSYTVGYRAGDHEIGVKCIDIALGDDFPIYRWLDVFRWHGDLQIGIEAGIWSVFNMDPSPDWAGPTELVNTDFYVGVPITYAINQWSFRLRGYHISSHLGDEYIVNHPTVARKNPSIEAVDFYSSYQVSEGIRLYAGPGVIVHSDESYPESPPLYLQYGTEVRFLGCKFYRQKLFGTLFFAMHIRNMQWLDWNFDGTYRLGYEFSKLAGVGRKFRFYTGFHQGYSLEGQFQKKRTHYFEFNLSYGF